MRYLLDTPLLAELVRAHADDWSAHWIDAINEEDIFISAITVGEIVHYIENEIDPNRREALYHWLNEDLLVRFYGRIITPDLDILSEWGKINAECEKSGKTLSAVDAIIAATVRARGLVLITFNREVFLGIGIEVSDPWRG